MNNITIKQEDSALNSKWMAEALRNRPVILTTKNPKMLASHIQDIIDIGIKPNIIVNCIISKEKDNTLEINIPKSEDVITGIIELKRMIGREKIILKTDMSNSI